MKILVSLLFFLLFLSFLVNAQQQSFTYKKDFKKTGSVIQLTSDSTTVTMTNYINTPGKIQERTVSINSEMYTISVEKVRRVGKIQTIKDSNGTKMATVFLGSVKKNNILLANGTELVWESSGIHSWSYRLNGKEVIKASVLKDVSEKKLYLQNIDTQQVSPALLISCMERGSEAMNKSSSPTGAMILVSALLAVMRVVMEGN